MEFCQRNNLIVTNTFYKVHKRRRYAWLKPGDTERYQLDYILGNQRYRNSIKKSIEYLGVDIDSNHNLVAAMLNIKLKRVKVAKSIPTWNLQNCKGDKGYKFKQAMQDRLKMKEIGQTLENNKSWNYMKQIILMNAEEHIGKIKQKRTKTPGITSDMIDKMAERRKWKNNKSEKEKWNTGNSIINYEELLIRERKTG